MKTDFKHVDVFYVYKNGTLACPECYKPVNRGRQDGRCDDCLKDKDLLPVNYRRQPKPKDQEEDDPYGEQPEKRPRKRDRD